MRIIKPNGNIIIYTGEEYKQMYKKTSEISSSSNWAYYPNSDLFPYYISF